MRRFYQHEDGSHAETIYYLDCDAVTGAAFVHHEWFEQANIGQRRIEIADFLVAGRNTAQSDLLKLIGTLVGEMHTEGLRGENRAGEVIDAATMITFTSGGAKPRDFIDQKEYKNHACNHD